MSSFWGILFYIRNIILLGLTSKKTLLTCTAGFGAKRTSPHSETSGVCPSRPTTRFWYGAAKTSNCSRGYSLKVGHVGDNIGDYYRGYQGGY